MTNVTKFPLLFVGHGSPLNAIEDNKYTKGWQEIAGRIPRPSAILSISAHWYTQGSKVNDAEKPRTVYDMYGFPDELYKVSYNVPGAPELAKITKQLIQGKVEFDNSWGIDHGTWSVLCKMYPEADIPVYQLSIDGNASAEVHFQIGRNLRDLREKGVLLFASGNVVHNLSKVDWKMDGGYSWAVEFDGYIRDKILAREYQDVINYTSAGKSAELAFYYPDHFYPLLYVLGASEATDRLSIYNESCTLGGLSMTSYLFE
ncbi:4,5-DOPA dioxygenase extradiol [Sporomusa paucivorans]|jgi:4,5-DOPA dioxygenase extradiol|uniref:4,5-DOPA-extradiol-dioxygenase n=1 Tax=Sporomusa paucivorans TaxID=2376 RepID=UPI0035709A3F